MLAVLSIRRRRRQRYVLSPDERRVGAVIAVIVVASCTRDAPSPPLPLPLPHSFLTMDDGMDRARTSVVLRPAYRAPCWQPSPPPLLEHLGNEMILLREFDETYRLRMPPAPFLPPPSIRVEGTYRQLASEGIAPPFVPILRRRHLSNVDGTYRERAGGLTALRRRCSVFTGRGPSCSPPIWHAENAVLLSCHGQRVPTPPSSSSNTRCSPSPAPEFVEAYEQLASEVALRRRPHDCRRHLSSIDGTHREQASESAALRVRGRGPCVRRLPGPPHRLPAPPTSLHPPIRVDVTYRRLASEVSAPSCP
ncbi:hypothetical protein SCHPADRAFT_755176 [Schizopora paradoxa]|uniref:Uncharacterized protein n=1 Tax=Schizopora paradoxa TaxID=27342 RepID=A0A0H2RHY2_9AGAM|nr:hypothetical protein SCHPADRAFT_755176 [Schizopora paradoxa]